MKLVKFKNLDREKKTKRKTCLFDKNKLPLRI